MQTLQIFNPRVFQDQIVETFTECPETLTLVRLRAQSDWSEIQCTTASLEKKAYFVPKQDQYGLLRCPLFRKARYSLTKVAVTPYQSPEYWLVTCTLNRNGYLLPLDVFAEKRASEKIILPSTTLTRRALLSLLYATR